MLFDLPSMICFDQAAVIDVDGTEVSYGELRANVSQTAGLLSSLGIAVGDRVGIMSTNRVGFLEVSKSDRLVTRLVRRSERIIHCGLCCWR